MGMAGKVRVRDKCYISEDTDREERRKWGEEKTAPQILILTTKKDE